jgi:hypothetical protein
LPLTTVATDVVDEVCAPTNHPVGVDLDLREAERSTRNPGASIPLMTSTSRRARLGDGAQEDEVEVRGAKERCQDSRCLGSGVGRRFLPLFWRQKAVRAGQIVIHRASLSLLLDHRTTVVSLGANEVSMVACCCSATTVKQSGAQWEARQRERDFADLSRS